ncbi:MAG: hypothetical protein R2730_02010 [Chitinophagales bacterium]
MKFYLQPILVLCLLLFVRCSEDELDINTNKNQQEEILEILNNHVNDENVLSSEERAFFDEIGEIANDVDAYYENIDPSLSFEEIYSVIVDNFWNKINLVTEKAELFYINNNDRSKILLAQNAFALMGYDALERHNPEFLWTKLGVFAANEVRFGVLLGAVMSKKMEEKNIHIVVDFSDGDEITDILLQASEILLTGQLNVFSDVGALAILNTFGAGDLINETWLSEFARKGYAYQHEAELAYESGDVVAYYDLQTLAAVEFGAHEQINVLQPLWDTRLMGQFAEINKWLINLSDHEFAFFGDIFIGTNKYSEKEIGYNIKLPSNVNNLVNGWQRVEIARNGFHTLNNLRKDENWSYWINYSQLRIGKFIDVYLPEVE